jgi:SAM-dependent methyltransferase
MSQNTQTKMLYQQAQLPIFQNRMYDTATEAQACLTGDMALVENQKTGLVYNAAFRPELMTYDAHYQNEQGLSRSFQTHLESVSDIIARRMGRNSIVEVGCGKGFFLEMLLVKGFDVTGFDPTYEGSNPRVIKQYFSPAVGIKASGLVLRHVLEHIQDPYNFLQELKAANGGSGKIYIEVPCFDWICEHRAWFDIFYEHVNYFRLSDFSRMFGSVIESGRLFGNQYLFVVADLATLRKPEMDFKSAVIFPQNFIHHLNEPYRADSRPAAIWGGASKGVIFALLKARAGRPVSAVIDINPAKQGKCLPLTGLLVQSPAQASAALPKGSTIYVMNSMYLEEIKQMSNNAYQYIEVDHE